MTSRRWQRIRAGFREVGVLARQTVHVLLKEGGPVEVARRARRYVAERRATRPFATLHGPAQGVYSPSIQARYERWRERNNPTEAELEAQRQRAGELEVRPLVSVLVPVFDPPPDALREMLDSVLQQTYPRLELCLANAGSDDRAAETLARYTARDSRVKVVRLGENQGISANSNAALGLASGEFVALLDHDDALAPNALFAVVEALNDDPELDALYSDEDRLHPDGHHILPYLKPDWSPEFLHSYMYTGHLAVYRRLLVEQLGGFRSAYDGSQDYDLMLRVAAATTRIEHVPQVLYHWRMVEGSAAAGGKGEARTTNLAALRDAVAARGRRARIAEYPFANRVVFELVDRPLVSIVIPTDDVDLARTCVKGVLGATSYDRYEILVVTSSKVADRIDAEFGLTEVRCIRYDGPYSFSHKCNLGAEAASGEYLLFLNDDVTPVSEGWIESMLQYAELPEIGGVSPKLLYEDGTIQYAGLVTGVPGLVGTAFHTWPRLDGSYHSMAICVRNVSCLTGACLLLRAADFWRVGGWDAHNTPISHSDLDLSYRLLEAGLRLVYTPFAELQHVGHVSRRHTKRPREEHVQRADGGADVYLLYRWGERAAEDPFFPRGMRELVYEVDCHHELAAPPGGPLEPDWWQRPRVLLVGHELSSTGAPFMLVELAKALRAAGMLGVVAASKGGPLVDGCVESGIPVVVDERIVRDPELCRRFVEGFDLIVANTVLSWPVVRLAKKLRKPCVWLVQEPRFGLEIVEQGGDEARKAFAEADRVVFPSQRTAELYARYGGRNRHVAVHYGIEDVAPTVPDEPAFARVDGRLYLVSAGSLEPRKGAETLVQALRRLPPELLEKTHVLMVGRFLFADYVERLRKQASLLPHVQLVGEVTRETGLAYVKQADLFVCPSRDESGPLVVLEAMALGKAVVSTEVGAAAEVITSGVDGELVEVDDVRGLADCIERLLADADLRRTLGEEARRTYERALTSARYAQDLLGIVNEVLAGADPRWQQLSSDTSFAASIAS